MQKAEPCRDKCHGNAAFAGDRGKALFQSLAQPFQTRVNLAAIGPQGFMVAMAAATGTGWPLYVPANRTRRRGFGSLNNSINSRRPATAAIGYPLAIALP